MGNGARAIRARRRAAHERRHAACSTASSTTRTDQTTHFLQIWIEPNVRGIAPGYEQKHFDDADKRGRLRLVASPDGRDGSVTIHADASISRGLFDGDEAVERALDPKRKPMCTWCAASSTSTASASTAGDAAGLERRSAAATRPTASDAEVLVFDLAAVDSLFLPLSSTSEHPTMTRHSQNAARPRRPHPARPDLRPVGLRQDRRLRRHRRLHRQRRAAAAAAASRR